MSVSFGGIGSVVATFKADSEIKCGCPVAMAGNGKVEECDEEDRFCGVSLGTAEDGHAAVQLGGYVKLSYSGTTAPTVGYEYLIADGDGGVCVDEDEAGGEYLVIDVDTTNKIVGIIM